MRKIPTFKLVSKPIDAEAKNLSPFKWAPSEVGNRHQLGGNPLFLNSAHYPVCPECKEKMTFYAQLDSINDDFLIADCGMIYVFICFECNETKSFIQSY